MKKINQEEVEKVFLDAGCECLGIYIGIDASLLFRCICGNISNTSFYSFKNGVRCKDCTVSKYRSKRALTFEYVYNYFKEHKCELLEKEYINARNKMKYKCSCGIISEICYDKFRQGRRCKECAFKKRSGEGHHNWNPDREYMKEKKKIKEMSYAFIKRVLKINNTSKLYKSVEYLGYNYFQLLEYLQQDPNYKYWKEDSYNWHIDHIIPISKFVENNITDLKIINALDNIRIISKEENLKKNDKCSEEDYYNYLKSKSIIKETKNNVISI